MAKNNEQREQQRVQVTQIIEKVEQEEDLSLGDVERKQLKAAFQSAAERMRDISARAQKVAASDLEAEMYSNLAEEACAIAAGLRRLTWKCEKLTSEECHNMFMLPGL